MKNTVTVIAFFLGLTVANTLQAQSSDPASAVNSFLCRTKSAEHFSLTTYDTDSFNDIAWLDDIPILLKKEYSFEDVDAWLTNLNQSAPTLLKISQVDTGSGARINIEGIKNGAMITATCENVSHAVQTAIALVEPEIVTTLRKNLDQVAASLSSEKSDNERLRGENERLREEIEGLRERILSLESDKQKYKSSKDEAENKIAEHEALLTFVKNIRRDMVTATELPPEYAKMFNKRYWALTNQIGRSPQSE